MPEDTATQSVYESREELVYKAIEGNDFSKLREISALPGGFKGARRRAWPYLLGVDYTKYYMDSKEDFNEDPSYEDQEKSPKLSGSYASLSSDTLSASFHESETSRSSRFLKDTEDLPEHPDEHQVQLDTDRSFVLYPVEGRSTVHRKLLQCELHDAILGVLRKRSTLRYFQGYHDIITVLFLTLPAELVLPCAEKLSLHRLRDSMGHGLESLIGQLRVLKRLLRLIDPVYAEMLERNSPLPYYALSNLLTLFSHDVPTLPLIQHIYDWLFCREPLASVWLAAAVILNKKEEILNLESEGDEAMGMMHALLSTLPPLSDGEEKEPKSQSQQSSPLSLPVVKAELAESEATNRQIFEHTESIDSHLDTELLANPSASEALAVPSTPKAVSEDSTDFGMSRNVEAESISDHYQSRTTRSDSQSVPLQQPPLLLSCLLQQADELLSKYPPISPELKLSETFGHQSALHTSIFEKSGVLWVLQDDEAEACVGGDHVVLPLSQQEQDEEMGVSKEDAKPPPPTRRRRKRPLLGKALRVRRQTVVAGTVLLIGIAVALYAGRNSRRGGRFGGDNVRWMTAWLGTMLGVGDRLGITL